MSTEHHVLALVLAVATAGCGGGASERRAAAPAAKESSTEEQTSGEPATVPCSVLLPPDEVRHILGAAPRTSSENLFPGSSTCRWLFTRPEATQEEFFQIVTNATAGDTSLWLGMRDAESREDLKNPEPAAGVGDEAYQWVGRGDYRKLYVRKGNRTLIVRGPVALPALASKSAMATLAVTLFDRF